MGIFFDGWKEKDKMTVRTNPTGEGVPVTTPSQGEGENPSLTLPKGEGNNGNVGTPNNGVVVPMAPDNGEANVGKMGVWDKYKIDDFPMMPTQSSSQGKGENSSLTLPKGEGNNGNVETPNNGVVTSVPVQKEGNNGNVETPNNGVVASVPVQKEENGGEVNPVLENAKKMLADVEKRILDINMTYTSTDDNLDNAVPYSETEEGRKALAAALAEKKAAEDAIKKLSEVDNHKYLADWSKDNFYNIITQGDGKNIPLPQAIIDYNYWAEKNNLPPLDGYQVLPLLVNKDITKSYEQNVEDEKTRKRKERWQQIGNVLSHMANLYGTIHYAPSQDIEDGRQLTERQQRIWDAERRERNNNVNAWLNLWYKGQQEKARERRDAAYIQLLNTRNDYTLGKKENEAAESGKKQSKMDAETRSKNAYADVMEQRGKTEEVLRPEKVNTEKSKQNANNARAEASRSTANKNNRSGGGGGKGGKSWIEKAYAVEAGEYGPEAQRRFKEWKRVNKIDGRKPISSETVAKSGFYYSTKMGDADKNAGKSSGSNNTPPSRRNNNNNTPPSRRK